MENFVRPSSPPKYFALDVDGTFYAFDEDSYTKNRKAFRKLVEAGYVPFLCTGRPLFAVTDVLFELLDDGVYKGFPGVYQNGASIYDMHGNLLSISTFSKELLVQFCECLQKHGLENLAIFFTPTKGYTLAKESLCWQRLMGIWTLSHELTCTSAQEIIDSDIVEIVACDYPRMEPYLPHEESRNFIVKHGTHGLSDFIPAGTTKAMGIQKLLQKYDADNRDCAFIGDGDNDIEAMDLIDYSFAVGNADDSVKAHAKYVLEETNEEGAFAKAVSLLYGVDAV
ncbi:HAD like protein [Babesia gibsoni]|uniref:HAD like protein n=1 Tax=Babesia gibsoni TaxID=33632 RepID=A0AAD8LJ84_BABGI|nr:HAD like protein [Babesia gibsoni]